MNDERLARYATRTIEEMEAFVSSWFATEIAAFGTQWKDVAEQTTDRFEADLGITSVAERRLAAVSISFAYVAMRTSAVNWVGLAITASIASRLWTRAKAHEEATADLGEAS